MEFFLLIVIFLTLIAIAVDWTYWRHLVGPKWLWWIDYGPHEEMDDHELRYEAHEKDVNVDLLSKAGDHIKEPDDYMERLIDDERFVPAMNYRLEMATLARQRKDSEMLRKYAIYGARISAKRAEADERKHQDVSKAVEEKREQDKARRAEATAQETVSAEGWRMPAIGKPPRPPLWSEKAPEPDKPVSVADLGIRDVTIESGRQKDAAPKKPPRRFLEFGPLGKFKPLNRASKPAEGEEEVRDVGIG